MTEGAGQHDDAGFVAARLAERFTEAARELLPLTVWLPVRGPQQRYLVAQRGDGRYVRAYTRFSAITAIASPDVHPELARPQRFGDLLQRWRSEEVGLVVNPGSDTEFRIPPDLIPRLARLSPTLPRPATAPGFTDDGPEEIGGFRFVAMVDGIDEAGHAVLQPERGAVDAADERRRIRRYLDSGAIILTFNGMARDLIEPQRGQVVPGHMRTDGRWIWSDGVTYYLEVYGVAPEPDFYRTIRESDYTCLRPDDAVVDSATRALEERQFIAAEQHRRWEEQQDQPEL